jgi:hypothetical protein
MSSESSKLTADSVISTLLTNVPVILETDKLKFVPQKGMVIYNFTNSVVEVYNGTAWVTVIQTVV